MAKILLSMQDLQARALAEIRKQPGCSNVCNVAINYVTDERAENNWSVCVLSAGTADANTAARAALYVQHALRIDRTARLRRPSQPMNAYQGKAIMGDIDVPVADSAHGPPALQQSPDRVAHRNER
jgi:hypothetical protein